MNTVQSAAALAQTIKSNYGRKAVEHISTALAPVHRSEMLERVNTRLEQKNTDGNWTLVATTCAEAGLNFSFRSAARELSNLASLIQVGGRVNRQGEYGFECQVWSFRIKEDELLRLHPTFRTSAKVLEQLFNEEKVSPDFCTDAMRREVREKGVHMAKEDSIVIAEKRGKYPKVSELFNVIDEGEAFTIIIDSELRQRLNNGGKATRKEFQSLTVRMRKWQIDNLGLQRIRGYDDLYFCPPEFYDSFLGYMRGILQMKSSSPEGWIA